MKKLLTSLGMAAGIAALLLASTLPAQATEGSGAETYRITLKNLTDGQPFSPPVIATHDRSQSMFEPGRPASDELAAIAQDGDPMPMFTLFNNAPGVTQTINVGHPLTPNGKTVGGFTDTAMVDITAHPGDRVSLSSMLICTNDGFLGLDGARLPSYGTTTYALGSYDAGRENNTETSKDIVDPCSGLGPVALPGDPNGNRNNEAATSPMGIIRHHAGIIGKGQLNAGKHGWHNPVALVTIEQIEGFNNDSSRKDKHGLHGNYSRSASYLHDRIRGRY